MLTKGDQSGSVSVWRRMRVVWRVLSRVGEKNAPDV